MNTNVKRENKDKSDHVGIFLLRNEVPVIDIDSKIVAKVVLGKKELRSETRSLKVTLKENGTYKNGCGFPDFISKAHLKDPKAALVIKATISIITEHKTIEKRLNSIPKPRKVRTLSDDLFNNIPTLIRFADFKIVSRQGDKLPFPKLILAARSPVLKAMLDTKDTKEMAKNEVEMSDFGSYSLWLFLFFLVVDEICEFGETSEEEEELSDVKRDDDEQTETDVVCNLLLLGDKYEVKSLVLKAEIYLTEIMDASNVLQILTVADLVNSESLVNTCLGFVLRNRKKKELSMEAIRAGKLPAELLSKILDLLW